MRAPDPVSTRERRERLLARSLLFVILLSAPVSLAVMRFWEEPYPSLIMPAFHGAWPKTGDLVWLDMSIVAVTDDGAHLDVTADQLLPGVRVSPGPVLVSAFLDGLDAEGRPLQPPRRASRVERAVLGLPAGTTIEGAMRAHDARTAAWVRARMAELFADIEIVEVRITLEERRMHPDRREITGVKPVQVVTVPLAEGG